MDESRQCRATARSGERCKRAAIPGGRVCVMHGGATPAVRAAAERRRAEAQATALLNAIWDPDAAPITDPVRALQALAGRLQNASDVLGARLDAADADLDGATGMAWARVIRELRLALEGMERLGLAERQIELDQGIAAIVVEAVYLGLGALPELLPEQRSRFVDAFLTGARIVNDRANAGLPLEAPPETVRGELG
jgi:hypothetical protein